MNATLRAFDPDPVPACQDRAADRAEEAARIALAKAQDRYWARFYWRERYYRLDLEYEDYAPAYCVGYVGFAQYGGSFDDARVSLGANWERIKGDSRLGPAEAMLAIRAAWLRLESQLLHPPQWNKVASLTGHGAQRRRWSHAAHQAMHAAR